MILTGEASLFVPAAANFAAAGPCMHGWMRRHTGVASHYTAKHDVHVPFLLRIMHDFDNAVSVSPAPAMAHGRVFSRARMYRQKPSPCPGISSGLSTAGSMSLLACLVLNVGDVAGLLHHSVLIVEKYRD